jgi:lysophospholipase L1-like esterase
MISALLPVILVSGVFAANTTMNQHEFRYLALGDSYTIGEGVAPLQRWPSLLANKLREQHVPLGDPVYIAQTGWTTSELRNGIRVAREKGRYDLVTLLVGVNNQYRGESIDTFHREFHDLLGQAITFARSKPAHVIAISIPDWGVTPFALGRDRATISAQIDAFNRAAQEETTKAGAAWVDITPLSRKAATDMKLLAGDGLHPSEHMYSEWVELIAPIVRKILE